MKAIYFRTILLLFFIAQKPHCTYAQGPAWSWVNAFGTSNMVSDHGDWITSDDSGNIITLGRYGGNVDFNPGSGVANLYSYDGEAFILKLDSAGNYCWVKTLGPLVNITCESIVTDHSGNVYVTGEFRNIVDFDPGGVNYSLASAGGYDMFVLKLTSNGDYVWIKTIEAPDDQYAENLHCDSNNNLLISGFFHGTIDLNPDSAGQYVVTSADYYSFYILKLDSAGNFIWAKASENEAEINSMTVSEDGSEIYVCGVFDHDSCDFDLDSNQVYFLHAGWYSTFICKYGSTGNLIWAKSISDLQYSFIKNDNEGNVYLTGPFDYPVDFDPGPPVFTLTPQERDVFILKLDSLGNFVFAKAIGGVDYDQGSSITVDSYANIYVAGQYEQTCNFNPGGNPVNLTCPGIANAFVLKLTASGDFLWVKSTGGNGTEYITKIILDKSGHLWMTGDSPSTLIVFDPFTFDNPVDSIKGNPHSSFFIAKIDDYTGIDEFNSQNNISIFPNPANQTITLQSKYLPEEISVYDLSGRCIKDFKLSGSLNPGQIEMEISDMPPGLYELQVLSNEFVSTIKLIVAR